MKYILFITVCSISLNFFGQTKLLTMEEAVLKQRSTLAPVKLQQLQWIPNSTNFSYIAIREGAETLLKGRSDGGKMNAILSLPELNEAMREAGYAALKSFPLMQWKNENFFSFEAEQKALHYDFKTNKIIFTGSRDFGNAENMDVAPFTNYVAYNLSNNLYVYDGKEKLIVTNDADENIVNGRSVHREEFGIVKGTFWSPKGTLLAFYRMDQTMVASYPIIAWKEKPAANKNIKYPMAGDKSHEVTVGVYNVRNGKTVFLKTGEPREQYLTNIAWSPDEQHIYIAVLNREQNHMQLNSYSAASGYFEKTLFEEKHDKYVHPTHTMSFVPSRPDLFLWQSERDGFNHIYLYNINGALIRQLSKGNWIVTELLGCDNKGQRAYYCSTKESPLSRNLYSVDLKTGKSIRITSGDGTHSILFNNGYAIDNFQSTIVPREVAVYNPRGKLTRIVFRAPNPLKDYALGNMSLFSIKGDSGDDLYCRMFKPINFDSTKKYPVIVYVYGGPGIQLINNTWNGQGDLWFQYMAQKGFVVFTLDSRGSANRGLNFEQSIFRNLGVNEVSDQLKGVAYLKKQNFVDSTRMGLFGWSYGGFMTTTIMTKHPNIFKAAVAGGPVIDWSYYEIMYTERYMDTPAENPQGYKNSRVINYADSLKGKLMIIHGALDNVVVWQHSIQFIQSCIEKKKQVDFFVYPSHEHNVIGKDREHLYQKVSDYFLQNL